MKNRWLIVLGMACCIAFLPASSCGLTQQQAKDALSFAQVACIIANSLAPSATLTSICNIPEALRPQAERIAGQHNDKVNAARVEERERAASARCPEASKPDGEASKPDGGK